MLFDVLLYASLIIGGLGLLYRVFTWFARDVGAGTAQTVSTASRMGAAARGILAVIFSGRIVKLVESFVLDVLFQRKLLQESFSRWLAHILIFWGFTLLLLMHALQGLVSENLFEEYYSTLNPFFFLRDLFGAMVVVGVIVAIGRRVFQKSPRRQTNGMDVYAIAIVALVMLSGIALTALKIGSYSVYQNMVTDFCDTDDPDELLALEGVWVQDFGVVSPRLQAPVDPDLVASGMEIHEMNCMGCHSAPQAAFVSYGLARMLRPVALGLDQAGMVAGVWWIHVLACFVGLAYLPFSKMLHVFTTPLSLMANAVMDPATSDPANVTTRQMLELDACTHCGTCTQYCSAMMAYEALGNPNILPSEKMIFLKGLAAGRETGADAWKAIQQGVYLCTNCDRCTVVCPSGIQLKALWVRVRERLIQRGLPEPLVLSPFSLLRGLNAPGQDPAAFEAPIAAARRAVAGRFEELNDPARPVVLDGGAGQMKAFGLGNSSYSYCFGCQNCTTVCPVVGLYDEPEKHLGLLPHQLMCSLYLNQGELAMGAGMIWDCVTCYQCQEHCPQKVEVTEIFYELKNAAVRGLNARGRAQAA